MPTNPLTGAGSWTTLRLLDDLDAAHTALRQIAAIAAKANTAGAGRMDEWDALSEIETLARKAVEK